MSGAGQDTAGAPDPAVVELNAWQAAGYVEAGLDSRVTACGTVPVVGGRVALSPVGKGMRVSGLWRCGNRWCPSCRWKVSEHRAAEVEEAVAWAVERDLVVVMYTLTASHVTEEELVAAGHNLHEAVQSVDVDTVRKRMSGAWRRATSGRRGVELREGRVGTITAQEVTLDDLSEAGSQSGIHWHRHMLVLLEPEEGLGAQERAEQYGERLFTHWQAGAQAEGLVAARDAFDVKVARTVEEAQAWGAYVAKGESTPEAPQAPAIHKELVMAEGKKGRRRSRVSPEQLLRNIGHLVEVEPGARRLPQLIAQWSDLEKGTKGVHWLRWSPGLRDLVGLGEELSDEEAANMDAPVESELVAVVAWEEVKAHVEEFKRVLRESADGTEWETLLVLLDSVGASYELMPPEEWGSRVRTRLRAMRAG